MKLPCDVNLPIELLFKQIDNAIEYASAGQAPYSPRQVLNIAYQLVLRTGIFVNDCKIWKKQNDGYKTWPQFKLDFAATYQDYNESRDLSPHAAGFNATNITDYHDETIDAIANLTTATAANRQVVANLTQTNASLTKNLSTSTAKLLAALATITFLTKQLADLRSVPSPTSPSSNAQSPGERKHYFWSCGHWCLHSSSKCPVPKDGHQKGAKAADTMNGSMLNKPPACS
jgi:hypothetical protein